MACVSRFLNRRFSEASTQNACENYEFFCVFPHWIVRVITCHGSALTSGSWELVDKWSSFFPQADHFELHSTWVMMWEGWGWLMGSQKHWVIAVYRAYLLHNAISLLVVTVFPSQSYQINNLCKNLFFRLWFLEKTAEDTSVSSCIKVHKSKLRWLSNIKPVPDNH